MDMLNFLTARALRMAEEEGPEASSTKIDRDPVGLSDTIIIVIAFSLLALTALLVILAWINRNYSPIRAKHLPLITLMLFCGIVGYIGGLVNNGLIHIVGTWSNCKPFILWLRLLNLYSFFFLLLFRTFILHRIFVLNRPCSGFGYYRPVVLFTIFMLSFNITAQAVDNKKTISYDEVRQLCKYDSPFHYCVLAVSIVLWIVYTFYLIRIRNIKSSFNEFRESIFIYIAGSVKILQTVLLHRLFRPFTAHAPVRLVAGVCDLICFTCPIWILLLYPVYKCYSEREVYLAKWRRQLVEDGLVKVYRLQDGQQEGASSSNYTRMEGETPHKESVHHPSSDARTSTTAYTASTQRVGGAYAHHEPSRAELGYGAGEYGYALQSLNLLRRSDLSLFETRDYANMSPRNLI